MEICINESDLICRKDMSVFKGERFEIKGDLFQKSRNCPDHLCFAIHFHLFPRNESPR